MLNYISLSKLSLKIIFGVVLCSGLFICSSPAFSQDHTAKTNAVHIGLVYPISNHGKQAAEYSNAFSFLPLAGISKEETGFSLSGIATIIKENAQGVQITGLANYAGGNSGGLLLSGFLNRYNDATGVQVAGFTNIAGGDIKGMQLSGFLNKAGDVEGAQVGGFINTARKVRGLQLSGFINIAESSDYPVGVINIIKDGEQSISISTDETFTTMASFRSGGRVLYSVLGVGYNFNNNHYKYAASGGIGINIASWKDFRLRSEAIALGQTNFKEANYFRTFLHVIPSLKVSNHIELYAGPTINYVSTNTSEGKNLIKNYIWSRTSKDNLQGIYMGVTGGLNVIF